MSMIRLNESIRSHILDSIMNKRFFAEYDDIEQLREKVKAAQAEAWNDIYDAVYPPNSKVRKMLDTAPVGAFPLASSLCVRVLDPEDDNNYEDKHVSIGSADNNKTCRPVLFRHNGYGYGFAAVIDSTNPAFKKINLITAMQAELNYKINALSDKKRALYQRVHRVINSVTTVKRLLEVWPEVKDFLPEENSGPAGGLPTEIIADLNKEIGL